MPLVILDLTETFFHFMSLKIDSILYTYAEIEYHLRFSVRSKGGFETEKSRCLIDGIYTCATYATCNHTQVNPLKLLT